MFLLVLKKYNTGSTPIQVVGNQKERTDKSCILWEYTANEFSQLPQKFIDHIKLINSTIQKPESKIAISKSGILARAHTTLSGFHSQPTSGLSKIELFANGLSCWANNPRTSKDMHNALQQIGKFITLLLMMEREIISISIALILTVRLNGETSLVT